MVQSIKGMFAANYVNRLAGLVCSTIGFVCIATGEYDRATALIAGAIYSEMLHQGAQK
jgi:hypothetical protein